MPGSLETITYQAQVLSKGSIQPELLQRQGSGTANTADSLTSPSGGVNKSTNKALGSRSWSPTMRTPLKDALQKLSRISRVGDRGAAGAAAGATALQSQGSDVLPNMRFLQGALSTMRTQQQQGRSTAAGGGAAAAGGAGGGGLHTVIEVRGASLQGGGVEASAAAARERVRKAGRSSSAAATATTTAATPQQQQQQVPQAPQDRPPSFELRATDVVLGNATVNRRVRTGQPGGAAGDAAEVARGSPHAESGAADAGVTAVGAAAGAGAATGFTPRPGRPVLGSAGLGSSSIKRRSANFT